MSDNISPPEWDRVAVSLKVDVTKILVLVQNLDLGPNFAMKKLQN